MNKIDEQSGVIRIAKQGSPSVLEYETERLGKPGDNEVLLKQEAIALNFVDVLFRNGSFPINHFPSTIGVEAAGVIEAVGKNVVNLKVGDRVGYYFSLGAYAERRLIDQSSLVTIPNDITSDQAASVLAKGLTARMLVKQAYTVKAGDVILVHAAAGGVGSLVSRWAKAAGATIIGTVGNATKKKLAVNAGIDHVIALDTEDIGTTVKTITSGRGVDAVYDGVGRVTFEKSVPLIKNGGAIILYGTSSGNPQIDSNYLQEHSIKLSRPSLGQYLQNQSDIDQATQELFEAIRKGLLGELKPTIYSLQDAAKAHHDLESSLTTGSIVFHPNEKLTQN